MEPLPDNAFTLLHATHGFEREFDIYVPFVLINRKKFPQEVDLDATDDSGKSPPHEPFGHAISTLDTAPTMLDALGLQRGKYMRGRSVLQLALWNEMLGEENARDGGDGAKNPRTGTSKLMQGTGAEPEGGSNETTTSGGRAATSGSGISSAMLQVSPSGEVVEELVVVG